MRDYFYETGWPLAPGSAALDTQGEIDDLVEALMSADSTRVKQASTRAVSLLRAALEEGAILRESPLWSLRTTLLAHAIYRLPQALAMTLSAATHLLARGLTLEDGEQQLLLISLQVLAQETAPRPVQPTLNEQGGERSAIRAAASALAAALSSNSQVQVHPSLVRWAEIGQTDLSPDVREPWLRLDPAL